MANQLLRIEPVAQHYAWGSTTAIPRLLGREKSTTPIAELWFGAHPVAPATTSDGPLDSVIASAPAAHLGADVVSEFGASLPFLLKLLAADHALSIQVHPTRRQAQAGYADEQARGVAANAPDRNYRDTNHKPELLCALTPFDALCGFRPAPQTQRLLSVLDVAALAPVASALSGPDPLRAAFELVLAWPPADRPSLVAAVVDAAYPLADGGSEWQLAARAVLLAASDFPGDIGVVLSLLLNAVRLEPGEAIFLAAGNVHAYLRGLGVEIMANSDNVLRCGLTPKYVDVDEVLRVADFRALSEPRVATVIDGTGQRRFVAPVRDFALSVLTVPDVHEVAGGPQILLCAAGRVRVAELDLEPGQAVFAPAGASIALTGRGTVFRASVGGALTASAGSEPR